MRVVRALDSVHLQGFIYADPLVGSPDLSIPASTRHHALNAISGAKGPGLFELSSLSRGEENTPALTDPYTARDRRRDRWGHKFAKLSGPFSRGSGRKLTEFGEPRQNPKGLKASSIRLPELKSCRILRMSVQFAGQQVCNIDGD
jgi:hypothetical protein